MPEFEDPFPIGGWWVGHPYPDLREVPREGWRETIAATHRKARHRCAFTLWQAMRHSDALEVETIAHEITAAERQRALRGDARTLHHHLPDLDTSAPARGRRQVGFRLDAADRADLGRAADMLGLRPAQLARLLTLRGVQAVLREDRGAP